MNNEEKILELLSRHENSFEQINQTLSEMKAEMAGIKAEMTAEMTEMKAEMTAEMSGMKAEMTAEMAGIKAEMTAEMAGMKAILEEVNQRSIRTQVLLETEIRDNIQLLFDGHELIKEKLEDLAPKSRVEELEEDVAMLKDVIKLMRIEIAELKKAQ